jgi:YegS/Rv2252/BmrU family lipid kinase
VERVDFGKLRAVTQETLVILNPASAGGATGRRARFLRERLEARFGPLEFETTCGPRDATRMASDACRSGVERLLVAGGDGTTSEVVAGLLECAPESRPALGLLPLGSGLDLARSLSLPRDLEGALDVIEAGALRRIDAGAIEYRDDHGAMRRGYFVNESSAGLSGETVRLVSASSRRLGPRLGFLFGAVGAILGHRPVALAVEIDGVRIYEGPVSMVVAANGAYFGAGMHVAPHARVDDGALEVVLVRGLSIPRLLANLPSFYRGGHLRHPKVSRHSAQELVLIPKEAGAPLDVDGESLGTLPLRVEILPGALRVLAPTQASG